MIKPNFTIDNSSMNAVKAKVELYNGSTLVTTCTCSDALQDFTVDRDEENKKFFGFGVCQSMKATLIDLNRELTITKGNIITPSFGDGTNFVYPYPTFYVEEVTRDEETNSLSIVAYDALYKASAHTISEANLSDTHSLSIIALLCSGVLGLGIPRFIGFATLESCLYTSFSEINLDGTETIRQVLDAIAEAIQAIYYVNNDNVLVFKRLDKSGEPVLTITKDKYFALKTGANETITAICSATELGDNITAGDENGTIQYVRNNPFWDLRENRAQLVEDALAVVSGLSINQFICEGWEGNYLLEIGDKIALTTEDDGTVISYVLNDSITFDGTLSETTQWTYEPNENETASNPASLGERLNQTTARVDKVNKEIQLLISDTSDNKEAIAKIELSLDSINLTLEEYGEIIADIDAPDVSGLEKTVETHTQQISGIQTDLNSVKTTVSSQTTKITTLEGEAAEINQALEEASGKISGLETETGNLKATVTENTTKIGSLETTAEGIDARVSSQEDKITTLETDTGELKGTTEAHTSQISALQINSESIAATVSSTTEATQKSIEEMNDSFEALSQEVNMKMSAEDIQIAIKTEMSNGVDKVETSTGFTFNEEGLNVSKSGSEMTTQITEDGMTISRSGEETLVADNTGVRAENLHATTYLIIGNTSRLEDWDGRTACFWIGG